MEKPKNKNYKVCSYCVMDTSDEDIIFNDKGRCNHCLDFEVVLRDSKYAKNNSEEKLNKLLNTVTLKGGKKKYDCLVGISGGVDSCYMAYLCKKWGLKPLLIHMDNGWNSEIAVKNVKKMVDQLGFDYVSYVLDWREFREIQLAFLKSSIVDLEMPTDIAIAASLYKTAAKHGIKHIISGGNFSGEGILPLTWGYHVLKDEKLYRYIVKKHSKTKIKKVPIVGLKGEIYYKFIKRIKTVYPLNFVEYNKDEAKQFLMNTYKWEDYGGKHAESKITSFWQTYVMPEKFNMDYRRATFSSQIVSGQISRESALEELKKIPYELEKIEMDKKYIAKKYNISVNKLEEYLNSPPKTFKNFPNDRTKIELFYSLYRKMFN
jgi:N-acetyl sugar amidotransferase